jgi:phage terminase large subunit GpA-like protein
MTFSWDKDRPIQQGGAALLFVRHCGKWTGMSRLVTPKGDPVRRDVIFEKASEDPIIATDAHDSRATATVAA